MRDPNARPLRLPGYNYARAGAYFVTANAWRMRHLFGEVVAGKAILNDLGRTVESAWKGIEEHWTNTVLDESVIMPNHMHGIIWIVFDDNGGEVRDFLRRSIRDDVSSREHMRQRVLTDGVPEMTFDRSTMRAFGGLARGTLSTIMGGFKSAASKEIHGLTGNPKQRIWHAKFYDHIVRSEADLHRIRRYIRNNPIMWDLRRNR